MANPHVTGPESGRTGTVRRGASASTDRRDPALSHPDCYRRLRNRTGSADPADTGPASARGLMRSLALTAGGDFHPAPRTFTAKAHCPGDTPSYTAGRLTRQRVSRSNLVNTFYFC